MIKQFFKYGLLSVTSYFMVIAGTFVTVVGFVHAKHGEFAS